MSIVKMELDGLDLMGGERLELQGIFEAQWPELSEQLVTDPETAFLAYANGRIPLSALSAIGGGYYLTHEAAAAWLAMRAYVHAKTGHWLAVRAAYRPYSQQVYFWNLYKSGRGNLAAYPGTSNHGLGIAVDLFSPLDRYYINKYGAAFGWSKSWSDAPSEWWHIKYQSGHWHGHVPTAGPPTLRPGARSVWVQRARNALCHKHVRVYYKGHTYGRDMARAVKRFQKAHHLRADGIIGPATWRALGIK
jgi:hypothetical protein